MKHHLSALCFLVFSLLLSSCSMEKTKGKAETDMSRESIIVEHDMPYHESLIYVRTERDIYGLVLQVVFTNMMEIDFFISKAQTILSASAMMPY